MAVVLGMAPRTLLAEYAASLPWSCPSQPRGLQLFTPLCRDFILIRSWFLFSICFLHLCMIFNIVAAPVSNASTVFGLYLWDSGMLLGLFNTSIISMAVLFQCLSAGASVLINCIFLPLRSVSTLNPSSGFIYHVFSFYIWMSLISRHFIFLYIL